MAYTVLVGGVQVLCDTVEEVLALTSQTPASDGGNQRPSGREGGSNIGSSRWTEQRTKKFFALIKEGQRKIIDAMLDTHDTISDDELGRLTGMGDGRALAGVFSGLYKNAAKAGADPKDLYVKSTATVGNERRYEYTLSSSFRAAAKKWRV